MRAEEAAEGLALRGWDRPRQVERGPTGAAFHVGAAPAASDQVEVQEGLAARVQHAGRFLDDDVRPGQDLGDQAGDIVQELRRAVGHGSDCLLSLIGVRATSDAQAASGV